MKASHGTRRSNISADPFSSVVRTRMVKNVKTTQQSSKVTQQIKTTFSENEKKNESAIPPLNQGAGIYNPHPRQFYKDPDLFFENPYDDIIPQKEPPLVPLNPKPPKRMVSSVPNDPRIKTGKWVVKQTTSADPSYKIGPNDPQRLLKLTNEFRAKNKCQPLKFSKELASIIDSHNKKMASHEIKLGHDGFQDRWNRIKKIRPDAIRSGENCGLNYGKTDPIQAMIDGWIASDGHRANLLGDYNHVGIVLMKNAKGEIYGSQLFAFFLNE